MADYEHGPRTTQEAREALQRLVEGAYNGRTEAGRTCFTIPADRRRDADCILSDVIEERDRLRAANERLRAALGGLHEAAVGAPLEEYDGPEQIAGKAKLAAAIAAAAAVLGERG